MGARHVSAGSRRPAAVVLAVCLAAGAAALVLEFALLPPHYAAGMEVREVVEGSVLEVSPWPGRGGSRLYPGAKFHLTRGESDGWVHIYVHPGMAGWVEAASVRRSTRPAARREE